MHERSQWLRRRVALAAGLVGIGLLLFVGSLVVQALNPNSTFRYQIVGGLGVGLLSGGLAVAIRYGRGLRDSAAARRIVAEERDERLTSMRDRAGARAYFVSAVLAFGGLMWSSWASQGQLPALEGDGLWNFLAVATVAPFLVYIGSLVIDERNS